MRFRDFLKMYPMFPVVIFFSLAVSGTSYYLREYEIGTIEFVLGILLSVIVFLAERKSFSDLKKTVSILNSHIVSQSDDRISSIPLPFVICSGSGGIVWYNDMFEHEIIGGSDLTFKQIRNFVPSEKLKNNERSSSFNANYNGKRYTVHVSKLVDDASDDYVLYFIDDTYYKDVADKFKETRPAVMLISVDAMDDVSSMVSQNEYSTLISDAERMIISWYTHYMCIIRKISDGRFIAVAEYKVFQEMKNKRFGILDNVREHRLDGVPTGVTVSIGIGTGVDLSECEAWSRKSLDMAKGRGGDQVVINDNGNYEFFGGVASGVESRNQVQSRIVASSIEELIKHSASVFVMGHKNSDLDSLGSAIGIVEAVKHMGIKAKIIIDEKSSMAKPLLNYYKKEVNDELFVSPERGFAEFQKESLLIVTDVMRPGFTDAPIVIEKAENIVVVDHHRMSVDHITGALIFYHEPNSSSAGEMVTELIRYMPSKPKLSNVAAEALLSGIYLDTKNFTLKTGVRTFEAAAYLKERGADTITVRKLFSATAEENNLISKIVNNAQIKGNFAFAITDENDVGIRMAAAKAADELLNIEDVDASFVIFKSSEKDCAISARSYGRVNVQVIMERLGGGGHQTMAAAQMANTTVNEAAKLLNEAVADFMKSNPRRDSKKEE